MSEIYTIYVDERKYQLKKNRIYIRRGTSCEEATSEEITDIIKRRMNAEYPDSGKTLNLDEHLEAVKNFV